jgi:hypothetical protein
LCVDKFVTKAKGPPLRDPRKPELVVLGSVIAMNAVAQCNAPIAAVVLWCPEATGHPKMGRTKLEVFQDLHLRTPSASVSIRDHVLSQVKAPWRHDAEREQNVRSYALKNEDVIGLVRESSDDMDEVGLVLWQEEYGYRVSNIVPSKVGELGSTKYNNILQDFVDRVARPAATVGGFIVDLTSSEQTLEDWIDAAPAESLRRFSGLANKSTGAAHPRDQERWFEFLIAAHRTSARLDPGRLAQWLSEVEAWPPETAHELAIDYEFALALLEKYDHSGA